MKTDKVKEWPDRWILIFLFARKHDVDRTVEFIHEHTDFMVNDLNVQEVKGGQNPVAWSRVDVRLLLEEHTRWKPGLVDKHGRSVLYKINRHYFPKSTEYNSILVMMAFWWYDMFDQMSLSMHRNGMVMIADMGGMTSKNWDFSSEGSKFNQAQLVKFPGRFRAGYVINANLLLKGLMAFVGTVYKAKVVSRIRPAHKAELHELLHEKDLLEEYGGKWAPNPRKEWLEPTIERYRPKGRANAWK